MDSEIKEKSFARKAIIQTLSGGSAGFVEVCLMHPLDVIKTRFQVQSNLSTESSFGYNSLFDCVRKMLRREGIVGFYRGIVPPVLVETPKRAIKFVAFEQYKRALTFGGRHSTSPLTLTLAGLGSGLTEAVVVNPFEAVKVQLQSDQSTVQRKSTFGLARQIIRSGGLGVNGINRGLTATMARNGIFNMVYFSFYHNVKDIVPRLQNERLDLFRRFLIGLASGCLASVSNIPFDVAKSRIQAEHACQARNSLKYKSCWQTVTLVYREEGFLALYKGLLPKMLRLGPGGAIMLIIYEYASEYFNKRL